MPRDTRNGDDMPVSLGVARRGIRTSADFAEFMGALMGDLVEGTLEPEVAKAACTAGDQMLRVVEMQMKYGKENGEGEKTLQLSGPTKKSLLKPTNSKQEI